MSKPKNKTLTQRVENLERQVRVWLDDTGVLMKEQRKAEQLTTKIETRTKTNNKRLNCLENGGHNWSNLNYDPVFKDVELTCSECGTKKVIKEFDLTKKQKKALQVLGLRYI